MSTKTSRLRYLRLFLKGKGYGRGYTYSAYPADVIIDGVASENCGMDREQHTTSEIAAEAQDGERWFIDVRNKDGDNIDWLTLDFPHDEEGIDRFRCGRPSGRQ